MLILASAASAAVGINLVYYVLASIGLLCAALLAAWRFVRHQRDKWTREGQDRAEQALAIKENNTQLHANTQAIADLTVRLGQFMTNVDSRLSGFGERLTRLEYGRKYHRDETTP